MYRQSFLTTVCTLPAQACLTGTTWRRPSARSRTAGSSASPPRRALPVSPSAASEDLVRKPARRWPPPQHLVLLRQLLDPGAPPQPQPAVLRRLLMATLGLSIVRNVCLYYPILFRIFAKKPAKTAKFRPKNACHQQSHRFVTAPFLEQKALKTANSEKCVFRVLRQMCCPGLQIRSFSAENLLQVFAVFYPEKPANSSPMSLSPPKSPVSNTSACRGTPQSPPVSNAAARRGPGSGPTARQGSPT